MVDLANSLMLENQLILKKVPYFNLIDRPTR